VSPREPTLQRRGPVAAPCRAPPRRGSTCSNTVRLRPRRAPSPHSTTRLAAYPPGPREPRPCPLPRRELELPTREVRKALRLTVLPDLQNAIVVEAVAERTEAYRLGVRPGMRLVSISDPARQGETWAVTPDSSFKFVCDAIRYRNFASIRMTLAPAPEGLVAALEGRDEAVRRARSQSQRRIDARKARMDEVGERDDTAFFSLAAAAFLVPAAAILAWAYASGYLAPNTELYSSF